MKASFHTVGWLLTSAIVSFILITFSSFQDVKAVSKAETDRSYQTENIIVLVIDGPRMSETFGDSSFSYIPNLATVLAPQGVLCLDFRNNGPTYTNAGHTAITTGVYQKINNGGLEYPRNPSMFQYYLSQSGAASDKAYVIASKGKLSILGNSKNKEWRDQFTPSIHCGINGSGVGYTSDDYTFSDAIKILSDKHPKLTLINLLEVDVSGHANLWSNYLNAIKRTDEKAKVLWDFIQSDSVYANKTTLFITNDHGRHSKGRKDGFISHGDNCEGCRSIYLVALGPDFKKGVHVNKGYHLIDIPATISEMLHFNQPTGKGEVMWDLFEAP